ncbi:hypothetical protein [uncultured Arthrobacter sp.]|uniref:hypothetical protein n=1 Tax=uncultured Arthrobacter sp. TaxID=114050 RepID=UPI0025D9024B|nr:hypothetical protein [uncultured Arthrobacter sp.]
MALSDVAATFTADALPHRTCSACHALAGMDPDDAATLRALLANRSVRFRDLARELANDPDSPTVPEDALSRHARGLCAAGERLRS